MNGKVSQSKYLLNAMSMLTCDFTGKHELTSALRLSVSKKLFIPSGRIQVSSVIGQGKCLIAEHMFRIIHVLRSCR